MTKEEKNTATETGEAEETVNTASDGSSTGSAGVQCDATADELTALRCELQKKDQEIASLKDILLRRQADFDNYRKRVMKTEEQNKKMAVTGIAGGIIKINDDLVRAAEAASSIAEDSSVEEVRQSFIEGVGLISKSIETLLEKYAITEIESENTPFDPNCHEAVEIDMQEGLDTDTVTKVYQKGYKLDDMVIRTAKVRVSKPAPAAQ
jgi:molecular chaperone GrpE